MRRQTATVEQLRSERNDAPRNAWDSLSPEAPLGANLRRPLSRERRGQTLIIALIVLGVLLVIGFVFLGIVNRNILSTARQQQRTVASDLAEAGIRYAHSQMLTSALGADWRGAPTLPISTSDPDSDLLRPAPGISDPSDLGGPDKLGPYTRVSFQNGRALIRVRYAPADPALFNMSQNPAAAIRQPGKTHNYLLVESYGRPGRVNANDPTQIGGGRTASQKKLIAMVSIGVIETARFITNKYNVSRPAEIGESNIGIQYEGAPVNFPVQLGTTAVLPNFDGTGTTQNVQGMGSFYSNAQVKVYGTVNVSLAAPFGDGITIADTIIGADNSSTLNLTSATIDGAGVWQPPTTWSMTNGSTYSPGGPSSLDSGSSNFATAKGLLRDGIQETDQEGYARAGGRKEPPSILTPDPDTGEGRYVRLTRESGKLIGDGNSGRFGHGQGVYVDNLDDRQMRADETGRANVGTAESLVYDWLNPNNGQANSGWKGPFYVPRGAFLQLLSDGFIITRDSRAPASQRTWRRPDGSDTGSAKIKFRIGNVPDSSGKPVPYIVNTYTGSDATHSPTIDIDSDTIDYTKGVPFNGVLYFSGNVRVRGIIPTDIQMLVVSNATLYIDGSITKGLTGNDYTADYPLTGYVYPRVAVGASLARSPASTVGLFAKDYVALNTTQFFGASFNQNLEEVKDVPTAVGYNPIRMRTGGGILSFLTELLLDPTTGTVSDPSSWTPFANNYKDAVSNNPLATGLMLTQTMDDGPGANSFVSLNLNPGLPSSSPAAYLFQEAGAGIYNSASAYYPPAYTMPNPPYTAPVAGYIPMYGLGSESWQRYSKFETMSFPLLDSTATYASATGLITPGAAHGQYSMMAQQANEFQFYPNSVGSVSTNDQLFARLAIAPHDVRIEAVIYAEEGSFFVIPGPPFNPNPNDTRDNYASLGADDTERRLARLENFGTGPDCPFYNEPLDVRVQIIGAVSENMPPPINQQSEWLKRWGWIPRFLGATGNYIPGSHVPVTSPVTDLTSTLLVPNLIISYDPTLGTAKVGNDPTNNPAVRTDAQGRTLPPIPRLPVSPTLAYFGEVNP